MQFRKTLMISSIIVPIMLLSIGCATTDQLYKQYPGYTVIDKETKTRTKEVPVFLVYCVSPNGTGICQVNAKGQYAQPDPFSGCAILCAKEKGKWMKGPQVGTEEELKYRYFLKLRSPSGEEIEHEVGSKIFREIETGQVFPK